MDDILQFKNLETEDFYNIIGCDESSSTEQILTEYKIKALACHPDKHMEDPEAVSRFATLQRAKQVLCDEASRADYDKWRHSGLCMTYREWCARKDTVHTSMHWASLPSKERMLEANKSHDVRSRPKLRAQASVTSSDDEAPQPSTKPGYLDDMLSQMGWQREDSDILRKFRNYEI